VLILHAASVADRDSTEREQATGEFISWLLDQLVTRRSSARIAVELRLRRDDQDTRFDRQLPSLSRFVTGFGTELVGICWDIANFLGAGGQIAAIEPDTLEQIGHVHLHDSHREGRGFHAPLRADGLPWPTAIGRLLAVNWSGAVTLEIRYRYATEQGEPWLVLGESLERVHQVLKEE
jgi:sugar phosphate isomerase/epimerase